MAEAIKKSVRQIVGTDICVEADDGKKVYDVVCGFLKQNQPVVLSFINITMLTSAFLNTAIGVLYKDFPEEDVRKLLKVEDLSPSDVVLLKRVVDTAKLYYKDPERMEKSVQEVLEEG